MEIRFPKRIVMEAVLRKTGKKEREFKNGRGGN